MSLVPGLCGRSVWGFLPALRMGEARATSTFAVHRFVAIDTSRIGWDDLSGNLSEIRPRTERGLLVLTRGSVAHQLCDAVPVRSVQRSVVRRRPRSPLSAIRKLAVITSVVMAVLAPAASAASNFGGYNYGHSTDFFYQYGSGVDIQVPRVGNHSVVAHELEVQRAVSQTAAGGLIQAGLVRTGSDITLDDCGASVNAYAYFGEWRDGASGYHCNMVGPAPALEVDSFWVDNQQQYGSGTWIFRGTGTNINLAGYRQIGADTAFPSYGEELNNNAGTGCLADSSSVAGFYGHSGGTGPFKGHWYVFFAPNAGNTAEITNPGNTTRTMPTFNWSVPVENTWSQTISNTPSTQCVGG